MGEIADMMLEGLLCCQCGVSLEPEVVDMDMGIPVICAGCYSELSKKEKEDFEGRNEGDLLSVCKK